MFRTLITVFFIAISWHSVALSQDFEGDDEIFGPTRVNGVVGNGALSIGISQWGEITVLRYPSPSFWDHLDYKTREGERSRSLKYFGALENQGGFVLIYDKTNNKLISLRDLDLTSIIQYYKDDSSGILITEYTFDQNTKVYLYDFVHPELDIFVRRVAVETNSSSELYAIHYLNLAPTTIKIPKLPVEDWQDDTRNDFAAFTRDDGTVIQFVPFFLDRKSLKAEYEKIRNYSYDQLLSYSSKITGIFLAFRFFGEYDNFGYVGFDGRCGDGRILPENKTQSAFSKIQSLDILISEKTYSTCSADAFSSTKICSNGTCKDAFFVLSAGKTLDQALQLLNLNVQKIIDFEKYTDLFWHSKVSILESQSFFTYLTEPEKTLCRRALISLIQATDRETKATVASISTQPPYAEDWPRDGAYFNLYLDLAGFSELSEQRNLFYERVQSKEQEGDIPPGTWRMNFYADGMIGGPWDFEIDQVGFVLWSWSNHLNFVKNKIEFSKKIYEALKLSAYEVLIGCRDQSGLQCLAHEDDQIEKSITMVGAGTVYTGIKSAMNIAQVLGDSNLYNQLKQRKMELEGAIVKNFSQQDGFVFSPNDPHQGMAYVLFPADFPMSDDWVENYGRSVIGVLYYNFYERKHLVYEAKWIISLIVASERLKKTRFQVSQEFRKEAEKFLKILVEEVPTSTKHMGETVRVFEENGKYRYENRIAIPHIWEATLTCLTSIALRYPQTLEKMGILPKEEKISSGSFCFSFKIVEIFQVFFFLLPYFLIRRLRL